ncbi:hypothetical protein RND81_01G087600 [Saponaria officinalis]|uniref:Ubiquitin-like protease family profile domain-containing protein n=1 Tax=Saponaria officinalis TaxID=3572 RepID=A0AAW1N6F4_SAPOF
MHSPFITYPSSVTVLVVVTENDFIVCGMRKQLKLVLVKVFNMSADEGDDSRQKLKMRGVTTGQNLKGEDLEKLHIEFDEFGQPTGIYRSKFETDMGVLARNIKITYQSWKKVPWGEKETLWKDAKNTWKLSDDKQKIVLKILANALKEFRSRLTRTYITKALKPKEGEEKSEKARASQRMNLHPHYLGRAGYTGKKGKWYKEELAQALTREEVDNHDSDPTVSQESVKLVDERFSDRGYLWIKAHTPSSSCAPTPRIQEVTEKFWVWKEKEQKGEFVPTRFEDALVKALGMPEHNGRTRGVGRNVGLQTYFGKPTSRYSNGKMYTEDDMRLLMEKVKNEAKEEMAAMMEKKWAEFMGKTPSLNENGDSLSHRQLRSSCQSTQHIDPFVKLKESVHCQLVVHMNGELLIVAEGMVSPWIEGKTVHNQPLTIENAHVSIDSVIRADAPLPLPWSGFINVKNRNEKKRKDKDKETRESANKVRKLAKSDEQIKEKDNDEGDEHDSRPLNMIEVDELDFHCQTLEKKLYSLAKDEVIKMVIDGSVYNYREGNTVSYLTIVEIRQMFRNQWLNVGVLQIWGSFLYQSATEIEATKVVGFMCPVKLLDYMHNERQCEEYLMHVLNIQQEKKYIMGAFYEGNHWMLIVVCLGLNTAYILDSQQRTKKKLSIKGRLKAAWIIHCVNGGRRNFAKKNQLQIKVIECPQQPEDYECGYYVMKWMYNITFYYSKGNEEKFEKIIADSTMSAEDLNEVKEAWATKCLENM